MDIAIAPEMAGSVELPDSDAAPEFASEMEIVVQQDAVHNYVLLADGDNIVEDVLVEILGRDRAGRAPEPRLFFNDLQLQKQKTLAECGIELGSVLHLKCTPRVLARTDERRNSWLIPNKRWKYVLAQCYACFPIDQIFRIFNISIPTEVAKIDSADSGSSVRPNGDGEMKILVQSEYHGNYVLEVENSNTIQDVLVTVLSIRRLESEPEPELYFMGHQLGRDKPLADYGIQDGSILHLECTDWIYLSGTIEWPNVILDRKKITITDRPLVIWEKEYDKVLLSLLVEQISKGGRENILYDGKDSWCNIVAKFNESTGLKYRYKHLSQRFKVYEREHRIVNGIRHHPKFSWDHQRHVVIATDTDWNEYIKGNHNARPYRRRAIPYFDLLEILFDGTN